MKTFTILAGLCLGSMLAAGCASHEAAPPAAPAMAAAGETVTLTDQVVDAGCAKCMFGAKLDDCETAIRVNGKVYLALGTCVPDAEEHGKGLCSNILKARVTGKIVGDKFMATSFTVLP